MRRTAEMCHCGRPLHYVDPTAEASVRRMIDLAGSEYVKVTSPGGDFLVQRHYIALHGLKADELPLLGFEKVS
jgi:hypothetical protein